MSYVKLLKHRPELQNSMLFRITVKKKKIDYTSEVGTEEMKDKLTLQRGGI